MPAGVKSVSVDYDDETTLVEALRGQQFFIISLSVMAPPGTNRKLVDAAAKAGVPWVMPNCWGGDVANEKLVQDTIVSVPILADLKAMEAKGEPSYVAMACSFWYEYSLALPQGYGFDLANRKVTLFGDGNVRINTTTWQQVGRAVAALVGLKELPEDASDTAPTLSSWRNKPLYVASFLLSQRDMLDSLHRVLGTTDADWEIAHEPLQERYQRGLEGMRAGDRTSVGLMLYTRAFFPTGETNFQEKYGLANEALGLPREDLDEATRRSLSMSKAGWNPFVSRDGAKIYT